ncbi:cell division protein ZipA C-terminal FtsZ-binding domain-containing protein [Candidatus Thiothrix sp. Deng01]|uniref:Cell division protein ZipA n=1 Tax=Candidatus Thiothrix phosphatis TaxID=3112415 RepID=A0ABU6CY59_9GAMM|nr:cell division protein ZipA C-terminal FtsZ-binding domain-containing protein [Candidatus Thiothrix sp. Deng01]MEB4591766.1 cell division protein ZipA C-terminal FtsZ-binding domain-containing protein [Candidatus Thiothrix sp. Deng01]
MELVSLIIMVLGLAALVGIYVISRISRRNLPQKRDESVPSLRNAGGDELSSVLEDAPARDGKRPSPNARDLSDVMMSGVAGKPAGEAAAHPTREPVALPPQLVLFIAADIDSGFSGKAVLNALDNAGLRFGDMDIFHRMVLTNKGEASLFSVANGVKPWTLEPEALVAQTTPGLSMILNLPSPIDDSDAIHDFLRTAERLTADLNGVLKDQNQQPLTANTRADLLALAA